MIVRLGNHLSITLLAAVFMMIESPGAGRADNLLRIYPELSLGGSYSDNPLLRTTNVMGDFAGTAAAGFYLDYHSDARNASVHYDTFAQLFAHESQYDRVGEGQYVSAIDHEHLSERTELRLYELFYRQASTESEVIINSDGAPQFNSVAATLLLANERASINQFNAELVHSWQSNWTSVFTLGQTTYWTAGTNGNANNASYDQGIVTYSEYHFNDRFSLGPGYRYYDYRFTFPGQPDEQAQWPLMRFDWWSTENLYLSGIMGAVFFHTQGNSRQEVYPAGLGNIEYNLEHGYVTIYGGQEPQLTPGLGGAGQVRELRGIFLWNFTQRLTGRAGGGYYSESGTGFNGQLISWGFGLSDRVNKSLTVYAQFIQIRRNESAPSQFLPSDVQSGQDATGSYFAVGLNVSVEAFRWNWQ